MTPLGVFLIRLLAVSAGAALGLLFFPLDRELVVRVYLLVAGGLALEALVRAARALEPPRRGESGRPRERRPRPEELVRLEDQVALASATAADLHYRLRPVLCEIAAERAAAGAVELDERTAGAAWELVRPDRDPPADSFGRGISPTRLADVVDSLERI